MGFSRCCTHSESDYISAPTFQNFRECEITIGRNITTESVKYDQQRRSPNLGNLSAVKPQKCYLYCQLPNRISWNAPYTEFCGSRVAFAKIFPFEGMQENTLSLANRAVTKESTVSPLIVMAHCLISICKAVAVEIREAEQHYSSAVNLFSLKQQAMYYNKNYLRCAAYHEGFRVVSRIKQMHQGARSMEDQA